MRASPCRPRGPAHDWDAAARARHAVAAASRPGDPEDLPPITPGGHVFGCAGQDQTRGRRPKVEVPNTAPPRPPRRSGRLLIVALAVALIAAMGCSSATNTGPAAAPAGSGALNLKAVCPDPVVVQTSWFPQSEHGAVYQLFGADHTIDAAHKRVTGPLVVNGHSTGVRIQVRAGGPAVGFSVQCGADV